MNQYFHEPYLRSGGKAKVQINLFKCVTQTELKGASEIYRSTLASKTDLASLKTKVDNYLYVDKLKDCSW